MRDWKTLDKQFFMDTGRRFQRRVAVKILVPLDPSPLSESIIRYIEQFVPHNTELVLLHVVLSQPVILTGAAAVGAYVEEKARLRDLAEADPYLEILADSLRTKGFSVSTVVESGHAAQVILQAARSKGADLIAMSTHGRSGLSHLLLGSVTDEVLRRSPIPVLVIKPSSQTAGLEGCVQAPVRVEPVEGGDV